MIPVGEDADGSFSDPPLLYVQLRFPESVEVTVVPCAESEVLKRSFAGSTVYMQTGYVVSGKGSSTCSLFIVVLLCQWTFFLVHLLIMACTEECDIVMIDLYPPWKVRHLSTQNGPPARFGHRYVTLVSRSHQ